MLLRLHGLSTLYKAKYTSIATGASESTETILNLPSYLFFFKFWLYFAMSSLDCPKISKLNELPYNNTLEYDTFDTLRFAKLAKLLSLGRFFCYDIFNKCYFFLFLIKSHLFLRRNVGFSSTTTCCLFSIEKSHVYAKNPIATIAIKTEPQISKGFQLIPCIFESS